jgi:polyisoprenoid-binding protein YceI
MKITRIVGLVAATAIAVLGSATAASAATVAPAERTVASVQAHVNTRAGHIAAKMKTLQTRVASNKHLSPAAKATIQADITKVETDTASWQKQVGAATTMTAVRAADPAQKAVAADLTKLRTDLKAAHAASPAKG